MSAAIDSEPSVDSRWWVWIALTPLFAGTAALFGLGLVAAALLGGPTDFTVFLPAFLAVGLLAVAFGVAFPLSLYRDAAALDGPVRGWEPSPVRYAAAGVVGVATLFLLTIPVSLYYLYRRRQTVGVP